METFGFIAVLGMVVFQSGVCSNKLLRQKRQNFNFSGNTPPPNTCVGINLCKQIFSFCRNGGSCIFDNDDCESRCNCTSSYTGKTCRCRDVCSNSTCLNNGTCFMNNCQPGCMCPEGFGGSNCGKYANVSLVMDQNNTATPCNNVCQMLTFSMCLHDGECLMNDTTCRPYCVCPHEYTGDNCQNPFNPNMTTPPGKVATTSMRPINERKCGGGFVCKHGVCDFESLAEGRYTCICDEGYIGPLCSDGCDLDCGGNGECYLNNNTIPTCSCIYDWIGDRCEKLRPIESDDWVWWLVGSCIVVLIILVLLLIVLPVWLWKRREIFIMKIVHYFQPYEDGDGKLFDAFISYKSDPDDEGFVLKQIFQKLEKEMGFRLCLHFRDFEVGETITNNILWAVENSRRTVLIISPNYLGSEFARFEYQTAQLETLRLHQRIIPVIYKDVSEYKDKIDPTLNNIMKTITYLEWPSEASEKQEDKFWKRLVLSLPKIKEVEEISSNEMHKPSPCSIYASGKFDINLLSYKTLNGKSSETVWTDISLDDQPISESVTNINCNGINSNDVKIQVEDTETVTPIPVTEK